METLKITPIDEIEDLADGVPVLAVEGTVKYAADIKHGTSVKGVEWTKQFFVLSSGSAEIACSMWDAEGSELSKGETVHIENTQNKKGVWAGMVKGSYQKDGERKHTLEIRANQVKISQSNGKPGDSGEPSQDLGYDPSELRPQVKHSNGNGVTEARKHIMQSANLYVLCVAAVDAYCSKSFPVVAQTSDMFQAAVGTLFIEASRAGLVTKMPTTPVPNGKTSATARPSAKPEPREDPLDEHPMNPANQEGYNEEVF